MMQDPRLIKNWIQFLKNNQIVKLQSDPKTGKLIYNREVTSDNLYNFLNSTGNYTEEEIQSAIDKIVSNKTKNELQPKDGVREPKSFDQQPKSFDQQPNINQQSNVRLPGHQGPTNHTKPKKYNNLDATDVDYTDTPAGTKFTEPDQLHGQQQKNKTLSQTPNAVRKREQRSTAKQKSKTGNTVMGNIVNQLQKKDDLEKNPKLHTKLKTSGNSTQKPRYIYKGLREDITDSNVNLSEKDVEAVFSLLNTIKFATSNSKEKTATQTLNSEEKIENLNKIKRVIRDSMSPAQRKTFWRALHSGENINEAQINRAGIKAIFQNATDLRDNPSLVRKMPGFKKDKIDINDLQQAWKDSGFPNDTDDIITILRQFGFGNKEIKKVYSTVFSDDTDADFEEPAASASIQKIADYAIKNDMVDDLSKYMIENFGEELGIVQKQTWPGRAGDAIDALKRKFGKKATIEEVRKIFEHILKEERTEIDELSRQSDKKCLGRMKK